jgi:undecaprenyl-diphosphatase
LTLLNSIILGIIQGLTEFLPVSSSGHLVLFSSLLNVESSSVVFEVLVHVGTLAAVLAVFWQEFVQVVQGFFKLASGPKQWRELYEGDSRCRLFLWLVVGTIPTILVALLFKDYVEQAFRSTKLVGGTLILTGLILFLADRAAGKGAAQEQTLWDALWVGVGHHNRLWLGQGPWPGAGSSLFIFAVHS